MSVECQNCNTEVTDRYARVMAPDGEAGPRVCPWCPDKMRGRHGGVRDAKSKRRSS